jgi:hypothetical protein
LRVERFTKAGGQLADAEEAVRILKAECDALGRVLAAYRPAAAPPQME